MDTLHSIIKPFNEVEQVAGVLGFPANSLLGRTTAGGSSSSQKEVVPHVVHVDPRSAEFRDVLTRVSNAIHSISGYLEIKESDKYLQWLRQLQRRAHSLVAKGAYRDFILHSV